MTFMDRKDCISTIYYTATMKILRTNLCTYTFPYKYIDLIFNM